MSTFAGFLLRLFLVLAGVLFAASLAAAALLGLALWGVGAAWARLTGRRVQPFVMRVDPRAAFRRTRQAGTAGSRTPRADLVTSVGLAQGVTDVEARPR